MSSSSPKRNSITSSAEYNELSELYREAWDRVQSGGTGAGYSGIHYEVMHILASYGLSANSREQALHLLKQLLTAYEKEHLGAKDQTDDEYLSRFDDPE